MSAIILDLLSAVQNIIFDLGGVLLNIDYQKTIRAFQNSGVGDFEQKYTQASQTELFNRFERGEISVNGFYESLKGWGVQMAPQEINDCWNEMLLDFSRENYHMLHALSKKYELYLLSNTNEIHLSAFQNKTDSMFGWNNFTKVFNKCYFSHEIGLRKPDRAVFEFVVTDAELDITRTIFIDDTIHHVAGAKDFGIKAFHYPQNTPLEIGMAGILAELNEHT